MAGLHEFDLVFSNAFFLDIFVHLLKNVTVKLNYVLSTPVFRYFLHLCLSVFVVVAFALVIGQVVYVFLFFAYNFC